MWVRIQTNRLTQCPEGGKIGIPAAPRNVSSSASALLGFMVFRAIILVLAAGLAATAAFAVTKAPVRHSKKKSSTIAAPRAVTAKPLVAASIPGQKTTRKKAWVQTWDEPTYKDSTASDKIDGEDLNVRKAAVDALGPLNGAVVVADPTSGRVLTIVNQPLALGGGFQPCSTVKVSVRPGLFKQLLLCESGHQARI
jgi:penicillin-binding protein 2